MLLLALIVAYDKLSLALPQFAVLDDLLGALHGHDLEFGRTIVEYLLEEVNLFVQALQLVVEFRVKFLLRTLLEKVLQDQVGLSSGLSSFALVLGHFEVVRIPLMEIVTGVA